MIKSKDRSGWIGASDTHYVMSDWQTETFKRWFAVKLGVATNDFKNTAMNAGTYYEHPILHALGITKTDRQIKIRKYRLRVNLDGEDKTTIHEVKTHKKAPFRVSRAYWEQAQVEMFASHKNLVIDAYQLTDDDYRNFFRDIDPERITHHPIAYDERWVKEEYLPRLDILAECIREGVMPP